MINRIETVELYGLPHCSTCKKAVKFLEVNGVEISKFHNIKEHSLSKADVTGLVDAVGGIEILFSKRARKYRSRGLDKRELTDTEMIDLMIEEYTFIKRPVLIRGGRGLAGFSEEKYREFFAE